MTLRTTGTTRFIEGSLNAPSVIWSQGSLCRHLSAAITLCCSTITLVAASRLLLHTSFQGLACSIHGSWRHPCWTPLLSQQTFVTNWAHFRQLQIVCATSENTEQFLQAAVFFHSLCPTKLNNILQVTIAISQWFYHLWPLKMIIGLRYTRTVWKFKVVWCVGAIHLLPITTCPALRWASVFQLSYILDSSAQGHIETDNQQHFRILY